MSNESFICLIPPITAPQLVTEASRRGIQLVEWTKDNLDSNNDLIGKIIGAFTNGYMPGTWEIEKLTNLKVVVNNGAGVEHLDINYLHKSGIKIGYTPDIIGPSTADLAFGLIIAAARRFRQVGNHFDTAEGYLKQKFGGKGCPIGQEVSGSTLGIVGLGAIGARIAKRAAGFDMKVFYHQRNQNVQQESNLRAQYFKSLDVMLPHCDFVVLCCPHSSETHHLFNGSRMEKMKPGSILVNVGRGGLVCTESLVEVLRSGHLSGAGLDVTEPEPLPPGHPLFDMPQVILTPHVGTFTSNTREKMSALAVDNMLAGLENRSLPTEILP